MTATAGDYDTGQVLTLTLNMSEAATVTGTPTLTLNDGGTASYVSGSGSSTLVFSYTVRSVRTPPRCRRRRSPARSPTSPAMH